LSTAEWRSDPLFADDKVKVIGHQRLLMDDPAEAAHCLGQQSEEEQPVLVAEEDVGSIDAAVVGGIEVFSAAGAPPSTRRRVQKREKHRVEQRSGDLTPFRHSFRSISFDRPHFVDPHFVDPFR
jgi:hypothetical protein